MFHVVAAVLAVYVIWRYVLPQPWRRPTKLFVGSLVLLAAEHHFITRNFFGTMASPEVPFLVLVAAGWGFGALIMMALFMLLHDVIGAALFATNRPRGYAWFARRRAGAVMAALAFVLAAVGVRESIRVPGVRSVEVALPGWPQALDGYRLVQLTDLHASRLLQGPWIDAVVQKTNGLDPNLIVITGDLVDGTPKARAGDVMPLKKLRAPDGVIAIPGNHEYYAQYAAWLSVFKQLGMRVLLNEHIVLGSQGNRFVVAGVTDAIASRYEEPLPDVMRALEGVPATVPVVLLSHRPQGAQINADAGADLQLSGHTHGGQAWGMHWLVQALNQGYVSGMYEVGAMKLYVSNGTGLWPGFPIRLGQRSEITQFIMRTAPR